MWTCRNLCLLDQCRIKVLHTKFICYHVALFFHSCSISKCQMLRSQSCEIQWTKKIKREGNEQNDEDEVGKNVLL